ncbi:MAG: ABC transporter substrate-binding protein [Actinomycetota bacterium]
MKRKYLAFLALLMAMALVATACPQQQRQQQGEDGDGEEQTGANFNGWNNEEATKLMQDSDRELDEAARVEMFQRIGELSREDVASIPLYAKPTILMWNIARLGPDLDFNGGQTGFSHEIAKWELLSGDTTTLRFGAEQWPDCLNPITTCANSSWAYWLQGGVYPLLMLADNENNYTPSPLVASVPNEEDGTLTTDPFTVTYELNEMNWEDGTPITGEDIKFTWEAIMNTPNAISTVGYDKIEDIVTDGNKVTISFTEPYAPWRDLFSTGAPCCILKKAAFESTDLSEALADEVPFAGGPYRLTSFSESEIIWEANPGFSPAPSIEKVIFINLQEGGQQDEVTKLRTGEIDAAFPQPADPIKELVEAGDDDNFAVKIKGGTQYEGLWFNLDMFPVNDRSVREALLQLLDRQAPIDSVFGWTEAAGFKTEVNHCLFNVPFVSGGQWCNEDFPTEPDQEAAKQALLDGGWTPFDADGNEIAEADFDTALEEATLNIWRNEDGQPLTLKFGTTAGNTGREATQLILIQQMVAFGIDARTDNSPAGFLFQTRHPARDWTMLEYASVAPIDPTITANWAGDQIPPCETCPGEPG